MAQLTPQTLEDMMKASLENFGKPDVIHVDPTAWSVFTNGVTFDMDKIQYGERAPLVKFLRSLKVNVDGPSKYNVE